MFVKNFFCQMLAFIRLKTQKITVNDNGYLHDTRLGYGLEGESYVNG